MTLPYARHLAAGGTPGSQKRGVNNFMRSERQSRRAAQAAIARLPRGLAPQEREAAEDAIMRKFGFTRTGD